MSIEPRLRVVLVRAGQTEWDRSGRLQGTCDLPLCQEARGELKAALAGAGAGVGGVAGGVGGGAGIGIDPPRAVFCAPDEASLESARLVASATKAAGGGAPKVTAEESLREMDLGLWEGLSEHELAERFPRTARQWQDDPECVCPPEGEAFAEARGRVVAGVRKIIEKARPGSVVALVLRPIALGAVRCWLTRTGTDQLWTQVEQRPVAEWFEVELDEKDQPVAHVLTPAVR